MHHNVCGMPVRIEPFRHFHESHPLEEEDRFMIIHGGAGPRALLAIVDGLAWIAGHLTFDWRKRPAELARECRAEPCLPRSSH